jgi:DNA polymerase I-like protein with 3'-5' exonuclease and polymerase domains
LREPRRWDKNNPTAPIHGDKLEEIWRDILETPVEDRGDDWPKYNPQNYRVAFVFKALNKLIQASSADQTKQAMKDCADNGYVPMLTVHDELCISIESDEQVNHIAGLMETCVKMRVPSKVDVGIGENWGLAK